MRVLFLISLVVVLFFRLNGQNVCFRVVDTLTNEPVPYSNIINKKGQSLVTNHLGEFCISFSKAGFDTLIVSNISYQKKELQISQNRIDSIIYLHPKQYALNEVDINWSKYRFWWIGNETKKADNYKSLWRFCQTGLYISPPKKGEWIIEKVIVLVKNTNVEKVPFRLHVYAADTLKGIGTELLPENVLGVLNEKHMGYVELDILKHQIKLPTGGVFVTVEILSNQKPIESKIGVSKYVELYNNKVAFAKARYSQRKLLKVSSWKPGSFYVEPYPFTNVPGLIGELPMIKVKLREIRL